MSLTEAMSGGIMHCHPVNNIYIIQEEHHGFAEMA